MPDPKDDTSPAGDKHPPGLENTDPAAAADDAVESTPGRGENQAGFLKEREVDAAGRGKDQG
jgi:hypothetical protein